MSEVNDAATRRAHGRLGGQGTTVGLLVVLALVLAVAAGEGWYLWLREDPVVSATRPVVTGRLAEQTAVDAASTATAEILSTSWTSYDAHVEQATSLMTEAFAREYRRSAARARGDFIAQRTRLGVEVVDAGVVRASSSRVQALLFLDRYVRRQGEATGRTAYRALVTVVHTRHGWLVSGLETR